MLVWLPRTRRRAAGRAVCMAGMVAVLGAGITGAPAPSSVTPDISYYGLWLHVFSVYTCETLYTGNNFQWNRRCQNIFQFPNIFKNWMLVIRKTSFRRVIFYSDGKYLLWLQVADGQPGWGRAAVAHGMGRLFVVATFVISVTGVFRSVMWPTQHGFLRHNIYIHQRPLHYILQAVLIIGSSYHMPENRPPRQFCGHKCCFAIEK